MTRPPPTDRFPAVTTPWCRDVGEGRLRCDAERRQRANDHADAGSTIDPKGIRRL